ncbi:MAG TPA: MotA/TolQ/ExbB proton channel family protein [Verrucomicrobiales bacterium]|nr:MotA/TolQ/ExbB proton channel family protein [Verrucomicrobiales bacterium]
MPSPAMANIVFDLFQKGGPVMWPILLALIAAVGAMVERIWWWAARRSLRDVGRRRVVLDQLAGEGLARAMDACRGSQDPVVRMLEAGLRAHPYNVEEAMQLVATEEMEQAGRFIPMMDTLVTLAPLLGLLGTVTGIMRSFTLIGSADLAVQKVTGGIAEALIATAAGLGIAISVLLPCNYFSRRAARLSVELQSAGTELQGLLKRISGGAAGACNPTRE